ncbi:MAG: hypothetical protein JW784_03245, partial [Candidatus Cloacimonetes bacterium]|nr:hypothetical protein [Candidatus Cloacimonadota bacterium]
MKFLNQYYFRFVLLFIFYALLICLLSLLPLSPGQFLLAAALATLLVLVVSFFFLRTLIRPLEQMSRKLPFILQGRYGEVKFSLRDDPFRETYAQLEEIALRMQQNAEKISRNKTG